MTEHNTGGPAFPAVIPLEYSEQQGKDYPNYTESGMTLRDYFAAKAMQADVMANGWSGDIEHTVTLAYKIADAMLEARKT